MHAQGYIDTYYSRTLPEQPVRSALQGDIDCDVCIVGGGLAGINTAFGLSERGQNNVVVMDQYRIGWGASSRNGGFVAKGYSAGGDELADKFGLEMAKNLVDLTKSARQMIQERIATYNIDCGPLTRGVLTVSWDNRPGMLQKKIAEVNKNLDLGFEYWPVEQVREHCKTTRCYDGLYSPHDFQIHSLRYLSALATIIEQRGGQLFEQTQALSITKEGEGWCIKTAHGFVRAKKVVVCCASYSKGLNARLENASFPVKSYVMVTEPLSEAVLQGSINTSHAIYDTRFASDYYRLLPDRRLLWGGRVGLWTQPQDLAAVMLRDIAKVYPQLNGVVKAETAWSCDMCYAPHKMPQIGELAPGYWYNTAYGGHGILPTFIGGEVVAGAIADNDDTYKLFEPFGLGYAGGKMGRYVAQMIYLWWRFRDLVSPGNNISGA